MKTIYAWLHNYAGRQIKIWHGDDTPATALSNTGDPWFDTKNKVLKVFNGTSFGRGEPTVTTNNTAGNLTITPAMVTAGILERDPSGANRTDTLPAASALVAGISNPYVGQILDLWVVNTADAAETIVIAAGAGGTLKPASPAAIAQNQARLYKIRLTNITSGTEAYTVYAITD